MSQLIIKDGITIGEVTVKKNYAKNKTAILYKVFHQGIGSEEDHFVFYEDVEKNDWFVSLPESLVSLTKTNRLLMIDVYSKFRASDPINVQDFTDQLLEHNFYIFEKAHLEAKKKNRLTLKKIAGKIFK